MTRTNRILAPALAAALAAAACARPAAPEPAQPPNGEAWLTDRQMAEARLEIAPAASHGIGAPVVAPARVAFNDLKVAHVFSPVAGRVTQVLANPGDRVRRGTPLAAIQSPDVGQVFAELAKAVADVQAAEKEAQRQRELYQAHAGARRDLEAAEANAMKARAEHQRAREKARLLRAEGSRGASQAYQIQSPIDGEVISRNLNPGTEVQGQYGGGQAVELFTVGELDAVWVLSDVYAIDLPRVARGAEARVTLPAYPGREFRGTVEWIAGALDPTARTAKVRLALPNPLRELKPEMLGMVEIAGRTRDALAVPRSAVLRLGDQLVVFVEAGKAPDGRTRFERRPVEVDDDGGEWLGILHGLEPGEHVVTRGGVLLVGLL